MDDNKDDFSYDALTKRINQAKSNPMFGIDDTDIQEMTKIWFDSYSALRKVNRRTISQNVNFINLLGIISKYANIKTKVGYLVIVGDYTVSILGGEGAFCDEFTYEVAIVDKTNNFVQHEYDSSVGKFHMSLQYQDLNDIENIIRWCELKSRMDNK